MTEVLSFMETESVRTRNRVCLTIGFGMLSFVTCLPSWKDPVVMVAWLAVWFLLTYAWVRGRGILLARLLAVGLALAGVFGPVAAHLGARIEVEVWKTIAQCVAGVFGVWFFLLYPPFFKWHRALHQRRCRQGGE